MLFRRLFPLVPLMLLALPAPTFAFGLPSLERLQEDPRTNPLFTATYDFEGIVALSNCSGSLVRFEDSDDNDSALILTNGHCVAMIDPGVVYVNRPSSRTFRLLTASGGNGGTVRAKELLYATMTRTDMALYVLTDSYADIRSEFAIEALTISPDGADVGDPIEVISGYWRRGFTCSIEKVVHQLQEGDWLMEQSVRYSRPGCEVYGGTSGSPVLLAGTKTVIAINNTGNESGRRCQVNNPCEIDEQGQVTYVKGYSYGQQINWVYSCRNQTGSLDLNQAGCTLPKP